ncbi:MAG: DNA adenine methylase [Acidobacteria bacterium]|nr:DNA adenine methylase [Acidobacteriota bacterium]
MPIKYLGSKRQFVPLIAGIVEQLRPACTVLDLFSGTSRVGDALKRRQYRVLANDYLACGEAIARCYIEADGTPEQLRQARLLIDEFNRLPASAGYFTEVFCEKSRYLQPKNGARVDAIREEIERKDLDPELRAIVLVSLMEAADRVDSTTGVQMAYLKQWAPRAASDLELRLPEIAPRAEAGKGRAHRMDAAEAVEVLEADIAYIDPPYNQHSYLGNYHVWESLVLWDKPEHYGVACKRVDCRERKSDFNSKKRFRAAWERIVQRVRARRLIVSFSDEGFIDREEMEAILARRGEVQVIENDYRRYVGARIGVFNPSGEKVGRVSHLRNTEYLYVVSPEKLEEAAVRAIAKAG